MVLKTRNKESYNPSSPHQVTDLPDHSLTSGPTYTVRVLGPSALVKPDRAAKGPTAGPTC